MQTMDRRDFIKRIVVGGAVVGAATTLPSFAWSKKVTPNPSLVDTLQWVPESDARRIVSAYREGRATPEEALPALFSLLDPDNHGFSIIPREVGRLRDFRPKEISGEKIEGLDNLVQIRDQYPDKFKETLTEMLKTGDSPDYIIYNGLPKKRFNPYVEALYWLALDGKISDAEDVVNDFRYGRKILIYAWGKPGNTGVNTEKETQRYEERWGKLRIVKDRMSTPLGIDQHFEKDYEYEEGAPHGSTSITFSKKRGQCQDLAKLGKKFLGNADYKTFIRCVVFPGEFNYHTGSGIVMDERYLLVVDFGRGVNKIGGPYDISQLDLTLARGRKIVRRMWHGWSYQR